MIKATFEPVVQTSLYPRSQIDVFVHVLQQDGGVLQAAINATTVALVNAGVPLADYVCAVTGGEHAADGPPHASQYGDAVARRPVRRDFEVGGGGGYGDSQRDARGSYGSHKALAGWDGF